MRRRQWSTLVPRASPSFVYLASCEARTFADIEMSLNSAFRDGLSQGFHSDMIYAQEGNKPAAKISALVRLMARFTRQLEKRPLTTTDKAT